MFVRSALNLPCARGATEPPRHYASLETEWSLLAPQTRNSEDLSPRHEEARAAGCDAFFCKPFEPEALNKVLHTLISETAHSKIPGLLETVKDCSCGRTFSLKQWLDLPSSGRMDLPQRGVVVEVRTCVCGSSLTVELDDLGVAVVQSQQATNHREGPPGALE